MGKKSAPKAPDYTGAAQAQGVANKDAALQTAILSNPNINTHLGSQTVDWSSGGGTIKYGANGLPYYDKGTGNQQATINQTLSPTEQAKYDQGAALDLGLLDTAQGGLNRVDTMMGTKFDTSGLQGVQSVQGPAQGVQGPSTDGLQELSGINMPQMNYAGGGGFNEGAGNGMTFDQNGQYQGGQFQPTDPNDISRVDTGQLSPYGNLNTDGLQGVNAVDSSTLDPYTTQAGVGGLQQVTDAIRSRGDVDFADRRQALDNDLRIRGFTPGSEGFRREMQGLERQQNDFNQQAILSGGQEQSRIAGMENARRQQGMSEQGQVFSSQMGQRNQQMSERSQEAQFAQQLRAQGLNEQQVQAQMANSNRGQEFSERNTINQSQEQRQAAQFSQQESMAQFAQQLRAQGLNEQQVQAEVSAAQRGQQVDERRIQSELNLANRGQLFGEGQTQSETDRRNRDQLHGENAQRAAFDQSESQRSFQNQNTKVNMEQNTRQQEIQEQAYLRQLPLNEINALRSGTQVTAPQFQQYTGAQVAPAPLFQATQAEGNFNIANAQNAPDIAGGLFQLGGAAMTGGTGGFANSALGGLFGR